MTGRSIAHLLLATLFAAFTAGCERADESAPVETPQQETAAAETPAVDLPADAAEIGVTLATLDDIAAFLEANADKVLVINFWATWCAPCVHEMPELSAFYEAYRDRGVAFLSLSADAPEDYDTKLVPFVAERDLSFHVYAIANIDPDELDQLLHVGMDFALPTTFVFDRERDGSRTEVQRWMRNITQADLERAVDPLIESESTSVEP